MGHRVGLAMLSLALASVAAAAGAAPLVYFGAHDGIIVPAEDIPAVTAEARASAVRIGDGRRAAPTVTVVYQDVLSNTNIGFDDPALGATRQATLNAVFAYLGTVITNNGDCEVLVNPSETDATGFLASAGTFYFLSPGFQSGLAAEHIITGVDPSGSVSDIVITVDFGYTWNSDLGVPTGSEFDLFSVLLHEVTHGLGIASLSNAAGTSTISPNAYSDFDDLIFSSGNVKAWSGGPPTFQLAAGALDLGDNTLKFTGANAQTALGGNVFLYTPATFTTGSSVSHWQFTAPTPSNAVMRHAISPGASNRVYQPFEISALQDLGYTVNAADVNGWEMY